MPRFRFNDVLARKAIRTSAQVHALVVYDISNDKRRLELHKYLKGFGFRVQFSGFEVIQPRRVYQRMMAGIPPIIDPEHDHVRVYIIHSIQDVIVLGYGGIFEDEDIVVL
jgi:CRISPR-associated protein Cas2